MLLIAARVPKYFPYVMFERGRHGVESDKYVSPFRRAAALAFQPSARSDPVEVAANVELQQIARRVARPPRRLRLGPRRPRRRKIQPVNEGVNKNGPDCRRPGIVDRLRQQQKLVARESQNPSHTRF